MISSIEFDYKKATQALNYLARQERSKKINKMKALKLIWAADRYHLRKYARPVTGDRYMAMQYGPVASSVKDIAEKSDFLSEEEKNYSGRYIKPMDRYTLLSVREPDLAVFSQTDLEAINFAKNCFGSMNQFDLSEATHQYPEWAKFASRFKTNAATREPMSFKDFFDDPSVVSDPFKMDPKLLRDSKEIFHEQAELASLWF